MRRREFIAGLGSTAAWPLAARAQQPERVRRIGVLLPVAAADAEFQARFAAFLQALALLGWTIGRNVWIDARWATPLARPEAVMAISTPFIHRPIATFSTIISLPFFRPRRGLSAMPRPSWRL
jgi:hypothetical protein